MTRLRLGFVGTGWIGRHRMEAMLASGLAEAVAICEPAPDMAAEALKLAPEARQVGSVRELLALRPDGVVIATPSALHAAQSIEALSAGAAVFCQKPLGRNAGEVVAVLDAARAADRPLGVDMSYRFTEAMRVVREQVRSGAIGRIHAVNLIFHNAYGPDKAWFYDPALSGGGCLIDLGLHLVDAALWTLDFPALDGIWSRLHAAGRPLAHGGVEDYAVAGFDLTGAASVQLACSWRLPAGCDAVIAAEFYGTEGAAIIRNVGGSFYDFTAERCRGTGREILVEPPDDWGGRAAVDWLHKLAAGAGFESTTSGLAEASDAIDRIYAAACRTPLPIGEREGQIALAMEG